MARRTWPDRLVAAGAWAVLALMVLPILLIVPASFTPKEFLSIPAPSDYSLVHFRRFLDPSTGWIASFRDSLVVAAGATTLATALGTAAAIGIWRLASRWAHAALVFVLMPMVIPLISLALGTYWVWVKIGLFDSIAGLIIAHTVQAAPFVVITVLTTLSSVDLRIERAALSLGASPFQFVRSVLLPTILSGIIAGAALAFVVSWGELVVSLFATGRGVVTLPKRMWEALLAGQDPIVAVASTVLIVATILLLAVQLLRSTGKGTTQ